MFSLPWYTYLMLFLVCIAGLGLLWTCVTLLRTVVGYLFASSWIALNVLLTHLFGWTLRSHGTAHFAGRFELRRARVFSETTNIPIGLWKDRPLYEPRGGHIALFGPPRSRKSWGMVMPGIISFPGSVVVSDLRGELFDRTSAQRESVGAVYRFDPSGTVSCSINLLDAVGWGSASEFSHLHRIVDHLVHTHADSRLNPFAVAAVPLLLSVTMHCHLQGTGNFPDILAWMVSPDRSMDDKLKELLASPSLLVQSGGRRVLDQSERLRASVWSAALASLTLFQDPAIIAHTTKSDIELGELLYGVQPVTLYLCLPFQDIARLGIFLGMFVEVLVARLGSPATPPRHKVLLCLDEMANLGKLVELEKAVSYLQGSGTQCLFTFQNVPQVIDLYGETSPLLSSVSTVVHYAPAPFDTLTSSAIAKALGNTSVLGTSTTYSTESLSLADSEHERPLLTPDEITRLPDTAALILTQHCAPILAQKLGTPPLTRAARVNRFVFVHRRSLTSATLALVVTLALWPLATLLTSPVTWQTVSTLTTTAPRLTAPVAPPSQTLPATSAPHWLMQLRSPQVFVSIDNGTRTLAAFATELACLDAMHARFEPDIKAIESLSNLKDVTITRSRERLTWSYTNALGGGVRAYDAWCELDANK